MAWFKRENYARLLATFEDSHKLHRTFDEWLRNAEVGRKTLEAKGFRVICVDIDPDHFPAWCVRQHLRVDSQSRTKYASLIAHKMITGIEPPDLLQ
jgi:hypothetical protein